MNYNELVQQHFFEPCHVFSGSEPKEGFQVISEGSLALGDALALYVKKDETHKNIQVLQFQAYGNPYLIAGASYLCEQLQGKSIGEVGKFTAQHLIEILELPKTKYYVAYMIEDVLNKLQ